MKCGKVETYIGLKSIADFLTIDSEWFRIIGGL